MSIIQYALVLVLFVLVLRLIRWIVALRFHLQFRRVGFFSITGIRYHQPSNIDNTNAWSIAVGKIKTRLKRPACATSTAWITIHLSDIELSLSDLGALRAAGQKGRGGLQQTPSNSFNRRLSSVGDQIGRIPWWYSISLVKHVLKFMSALPAQLMMAGLANYVDVRIDRLRVSLDHVGVLEMERLDFSSIMFAAVSRVPLHRPSRITPTTWMDAVQHHFTSDSDNNSSSSSSNHHHFHARRQRHSLKRAEHLFKEKFFEITVQMGHVGFHPANGTTTNDILSLPKGSRVAISCHLSAGCVTLKDVDVNMHVDAIQLRLDQVSRITQAIQSIRQQAKPSRQQQQRRQGGGGGSGGGNKLTRLVRNMTITISDTAFTYETPLGLYSSIRLHTFMISATVATMVVQGSVEHIKWSVFNDKPESATEYIEPLKIPRTRISMAMVNGPLVSNIPATIPEDGEQLTTTTTTTTAPSSMLRNMALDQLVGNKKGNNTNAARRRRHVEANVSFKEPKLTVDMDKIGLLRAFLSDHKTSSSSSTEDTRHEKKGTWIHKEKQFDNLPNVSLSIQLERPLLDFRHSKDGGHGLVSCVDVTLEVSGGYVPLTKSVTSPPISPLCEEFGVRKRRQPKPWSKLFRKSWKPEPEEVAATAATVDEWMYHARAGIKIEHLAVRWARSLNAVVKEPALVTVERGELGARVQMAANVTKDDDSKVTWAWEKQHNQVEFSVRAPVLHFGIHKQRDLAFWINQILNSLKSPKIQPQQQPRHTPPMDPRILKHIKVSVLVADLAIILVSVDKGIKGQRPVPDQHMDNAPEHDIDSQMTVGFESLSLGFSGTGVARQHRLSVSSEDSQESSTHNRYGMVRGSIQSFTVRSGFSPSEDHDYHGDHLLFWSSRVSLSADLFMDETCAAVLSPAMVVKKCGFQYSIREHYAIILALYDFMDLKRHVFSTTQQKTTTPGRRPRVKVEKAQLQINRGDVALSLPNKTKLYWRMDGLRTEIKMHGNDDDDEEEDRQQQQQQQPTLSIRNITLYGETPKQKGKWDQLLELDNVSFELIKSRDKKTFQFVMSKLMLRVPYQYVVANVVDNTVSFIKALKAMHGRFSNTKPFTYLGPSLSPGPRALPTIILKCDAFRLHFDDDPFEIRLRMIWRTGLAEQQSRLALQEAFQAKAQTIMQEASSPKDTTNMNTAATATATANNAPSSGRRAMDNEQARSKFLGSGMKKSGSSSGRDDDAASSTATDDDNDSANVRVKEAWHGLQEIHSNSWIKHINEAMHKEESEHESIRLSDYRHACMMGGLDDLYDEQQHDEESIASLFCIQTMPIPPHPPLFDFTIMNMSFTMRQPDFPLDETRQFVHENGKGIPIDTKFSTLVPFHLDWCAGETWAQIRDYPLPVLLVPPPTGHCEVVGDEQPPVSWSLSGDYVLGDELGHLDATRRINIPIVVAEDTLSYSMDIARTSTPAKFYSIVNIDVHTQDMSSISWSVPYQPAIQDVSRVLDSFTRPPVDPSPKVGFWDKIRLLIHTRAKISFVGGGDFAFLMKGTRDPYDTSERGYGLAKVWSNDVAWLINHDNPDREVLQIISRDYAFGVPDLDYGGYTATYILPGINAKDDQQQNHDTHDKNACAPKRTRTLTSLLNATRSDPRFVKVALKLSDGIRMGIGFHLERMCGWGCENCKDGGSTRRISINPRLDTTRCRFLHFKPHYGVRFKTPQAVKALPDHGEGYDAYEGFRSHFIHISISIIKLSSEKNEKIDISTANLNSMHLSPGFMDHFVTWFRLFGGAMGYPMRNGPLFPRSDPRPTKKFGKHMTSMKYKVMLHPLVIGYFYKDEFTSDDNKHVEETGDSVGLKGVVAGFDVDIHQRREIIDVTNHKLDSKRLKANWPVHEAEIHLKSIDLRAVRARFTGTSATTTTTTTATNGPGSINSGSGGGGDAGTIGSSAPPSINITHRSSDSMSDSSVDPDLMDGLDKRANEDNEPSDWADPDDYIELRVTAPTTQPTVQVLPFVYSPLVYYLKQTNRGGRDKYRYLRDTHNCIVDTAGDTREIQMELLKQRSQDIDVQIRKHQARLHVVESKYSETDDERFLVESQSIVEKTEVLFEKRNQLQRYLKQLSTQTMPNVSDTSSTSDNSTTYSTSTVFCKDSVARWEELMGYFKQRCIVHNPQIIWNNSVRNIIYHFLDLQAHRRALTYYGSMRAVKFLRDLTEATQKQRRWKPDTVVVDDDGDGNGGSMPHELLEKLLSEQYTKLVATNETEDGTDTGRAPDNDMPASGGSIDVNDPVYQKNSVPEGYSIKSSYLVDLIHPQVSLQSDRDPDSLVLMSNERMQVKGFAITDVNDPDEEMDLVKDRTIVSVENSQFFVAKKERFDSVDLLLDNHYGAKQSDRWLAWIPPEMLIDYVKRTDKFQRVGFRLAASIQYDKYNQLRFKTHPTSFARIHPFEDRCDSVHLSFPELTLTVNSQQYNAIYEVVTDLLLYKEPAKKERLDRLREIMMAADRNSLHETTERIARHQDHVRQLVYMYTQYRQRLPHLDQGRIEEFRSIRAAMREQMEELYLGMEAIKLTQQRSQRGKNYHEPKTNLKFVFSAEKIVWKMMLDQDKPLCEWNLTNTMYMLINREDRSSSNTVEVEMLHIKNTTSSPVFTDVIAPYYGNNKKAPDFSRNKMLRGYLADLPPVGGIPVIQHLEINLCPLRLQITYELGKALASFLFPVERRKSAGNTTSNSNDKSPVSPVTAAAATALENESGMQVSASTGDMFLAASGLEDFQQSAPALLENNNNNGNASTAASESTSAPTSMKKGLKQAKRKRAKKAAVDDLSVMKKRASSNRAFLLVKIPGTRHCLSYQGPKEKNIEDLRDFTFQQPTLEYSNETWSWYELLATVKRDFMRAALLHNSTALLKEKLTIRRHHTKEQPPHKMTESGISTQSTPSDMFGDADTRIYGDSDNESSDSTQDELEEGELDHDAISLRSVSLYDQDAAESTTAPSTSSHTPSRRFIPWSLKSRKRQTSDQSHDHEQQQQHHHHPRDKRHSVDSIELRGETSTALDEELTTKGRMLLGKKYNGPIYAFAAGPSKPPSKGRKVKVNGGID